MRGEYLLVGTGGPVEVGIHNAPFLCGHSADHDGIVGFESACQKGLRDPEHECDGSIVILKTAEVGIIVGR